MMTYTERWGEFWKMFIIEKYFLKSNKSRRMSKKALINLANQFESFLANLKEDLQIAG
jgi:hypothetical protein